MSVRSKNSLAIEGLSQIATGFDCCRPKVSPHVSAGLSSLILALQPRPASDLRCNGFREQSILAMRRWDAGKRSACKRLAWHAPAPFERLEIIGTGREKLK